MPQRRRKEAGDQPPVTADLTSFFTQPVGKEVEQPHLREDVEALVLALLKSRGLLTRSELYEWAKKRGIKPVELYRSLSSLLSKGLLGRRFDAEREEYVFYLAR